LKERNDSLKNRKRPLIDSSFKNCSDDDDDEQGKGSMKSWANSTI
jgi:hypothetical protein